MSRRHRAEKREILPDPKFNDVILSKFINVMMIDGKKSVAEKIMYKALEILDKRANDVLGADEGDTAATDEGTATTTTSGMPKGLRVFHKALRNAAPHTEVKSRRVGGATYQVPMEVRPERGRALGTRWIIGHARNRSENEMYNALAGELLDTAANKGSTIKKRDETHKMAEANRAFAHFRW